MELLIIVPSVILLIWIIVTLSQTQKAVDEIHQLDDRLADLNLDTSKRVRDLLHDFGELLSGADREVVEKVRDDLRSGETRVVDRLSQMMCLDMVDRLILNGRVRESDSKSIVVRYWDQVYGDSGSAVQDDISQVIERLRRDFTRPQDDQSASGALPGGGSN